MRRAAWCATDAPPAQRRPPVQREKVEQQQIVNLLRSLGAAVYILGTRRPRGDHHGTCQTPGIADLYVFLPPHPRRPGAPSVALWVEVKAAGGRLREEQRAFKAACDAADVAHVVGGVNDVVAWLIADARLKPEQIAAYRQPA